MVTRTDDGDDDEHAPALPAVGAVVDGGYRIERVIATGGMGVVLQARQESLGRSVALKLLRRAGDERAARLLQEARAAAAIESDHVARVFDVGRLGTGEPFIAMELLEGSTLAERLESEGAFEVADAIDLVLEACVAVAEAHERGIVHRDLKPSNLFFARQTGASPIVKVLDFGISKVESGGSSTMTETGLQLGTPVYMAPEQVRDARNADARSDIWALGVVLHELVTGRRPFDGRSLPGIGASIVSDEPRRLGDDRPGVPATLEKVVLRCLEKRPVARYQTVADLVRALVPHATPRGRAAAERVSRVVREIAPSTTADPPARVADATASTAAKRSGETLDATSGPSAEKLRSPRSLGILLAAAAVAAAVGIWWMATGPLERSGSAVPAAQSPPASDPAPAPKVEAMPAVPQAPRRDAAAARVSRPARSAISPGPAPRVRTAASVPPAPQSSSDPFEHRK